MAKKHSKRYRKAIELGVEMIECDVNITRDGRLVMIHDWTLDRTTTGTGRVSASTWEEIQQPDTRPARIREHRRQEQQPFSRIDRVVQADDEVTGEADETVPAELPAGEPGGACGCGGEGRRQ